MSVFYKATCVGLVGICGAVTAILAAPSNPSEATQPGNQYLAYTKAAAVDEEGICEIPPRFKWLVETGSSGYDLQGNPLPDPRIMLRLHDPNAPYKTAFIAQLDLATAARLHHELGEILVKKLENPNFQHHPPYYDSALIPQGVLRGIDDKGKAIIELEYPTERPK